MGGMERPSRSGIMELFFIGSDVPSLSSCLLVRWHHVDGCWKAHIRTRWIVCDSDVKNIGIHAREVTPVVTLEEG